MNACFAFIYFLFNHFSPNQSMVWSYDKRNHIHPIGLSYHMTWGAHMSQCFKQCVPLSHNVTHVFHMWPGNNRQQLVTSCYRGGKPECQFDWCVWNRNTFLQGCRVDFVVGSNTPLLVSVTNQKSWKNLTTGNQRPWYYDKCWHYTAMGYYWPVRNTGWKS